MQYIPALLNPVHRAYTIQGKVVQLAAEQRSEVQQMAQELRASRAVNRLLDSQLVTTQVSLSTTIILEVINHDMW